MLHNRGLKTGADPRGGGGVLGVRPGGSEYTTPSETPKLHKEGGKPCACSQMQCISVVNNYPDPHFRNPASAPVRITGLYNVTSYLAVT